MATFTKSLSLTKVSFKCLQQVFCPQFQAYSSCRSVLQITSTHRTPACCWSMFHTSSLQVSYRNTEFEDEPLKKVGRARLVPPNWTKYNTVVYKPTPIGEPERPAEICHFRMNIKYSTKKMWYIAQMIRGFSIDEAIKQLAFHKRKGAAHVKEVLEEAQEMAVRDHNVEFKSNLWISDSFCTRGIIVKGLRRHARARYGIIQYRYTNFFVRLREGKPPKHYYPPEMTGNELMERYIQKQRERRLLYGL
ncbi:39S ribosomal protein L22, mitochondrial-like isoform X2 [Biomphalaria glabrata]|uniref:Large ribosomal subunit protein uL22m n=1 Tax=Biomphalaria glabrata TaxID=6526 RepID=A0A9W3B4K2_BIOGL|nr:39S ribosomal protein L22, mitochondrial-like isoform X2 [Biomphalaria glabrata]